ncbi:MAG: D-ribose pyranase [Clostridia bacterium]|nr:D-ribose pyranase [Clostridia bacterium]NCC75504.1 D-ribose pyranase [Clostridia bacterium]
MKKSGPLNSSINRVLGELRHTDTLCIADCGLPSPAGVETIDLALKLGSPSFLETLAVVQFDMVIEKITLAQEIESANPVVLSQIRQLLPDVPVEWTSHDQFKQQTRSCRAIIRTGEATPYANIILHAGVIF